MSVATIKIKMDADTRAAMKKMKEAQDQAQKSGVDWAKAYDKASASVESFSKTVGKISGILGI